MNKKLSFIEITDAALNKIKYFISQKNNVNLKLRIYITGGGCSGFQYNFVFDDIVNNDDFFIEKHGIIVVVDAISFQYLIGGSIDYIENFEGSRFIVTNPNARITCSCGSSFSI